MTVVTMLATIYLGYPGPFFFKSSNNFRSKIHNPLRSKSRESVVIKFRLRPTGVKSHEDKELLKMEIVYTFKMGMRILLKLFLRCYVDDTTYLRASQIWFGRRRHVQAPKTEVFVTEPR